MSNYLWDIHQSMYEIVTKDSEINMKWKHTKDSEADETKCGVSRVRGVGDKGLRWSQWEACASSCASISRILQYPQFQKVPTHLEGKKMDPMG